MHLLRIPLAALLLVGGTLFAQDDVANVNGGRVFFERPAPRPLNIAVYRGPGAFASSVENIMVNVRAMPQATYTMIPAEEFATRDLSGFDVVVFSGGSGSGQARGLGEEGRENVRRFVREGGGFVGICAGAYLACSGYDWGLGLINAKTVSPRWRRGRGYMDVELDQPGHAVFAPVTDVFKVRYANGPIITRDNSPDAPDYHVLAWFRSEIAENDTPVGIMINSPAMVGAVYGRGRVFASSPHPENTPGVENMIPMALYWAAAK